MGQRHILHCDCNCFYASVEMQEHPELRGKSIAVCGDPEARHGIVLTASYPAKRMGVKTGMPIWEAKQHCRDLIIVPASYGKYQKYSGYVREVFNDYIAVFGFMKADKARITATAVTAGKAVTAVLEISCVPFRFCGQVLFICGVSFCASRKRQPAPHRRQSATQPTIQGALLRGQLARGSGCCPVLR